MEVLFVKFKYQKINMSVQCEFGLQVKIVGDLVWHYQELLETRLHENTG